MIYFIQHTDYVKIGVAKSIKNRLIQLQTNCPVRLKVLAIIEGNYEKERELHTLFMNDSSSGEWFRYSKELKEYISKLDKTLMWKNGFIEKEFYPYGGIKKVRLELNLSMEELGNKLGISKQAVMDMEKRELSGAITISTLIKAFDVLGYKYEYRAVSK